MDTGSPVSIVSFSHYNRLFKNFKLLPTAKTVTGLSGCQMQVKGEIEVATTCCNLTKTVRFLIVDDSPLLLGLDFISLFKLNIVLNSNISNAEIPNDLYKKIIALGQNEGGMKIKPVELSVDGNPRFCNSRNVPYGLRKPVEDELTKLQKDGIIFKVDSSRWATPIVTVKKSNGSLRLWGDYRTTLNPALKQSAVTTPEPEDVFANLQGSQIFSTVDLKNAFLQIPLSTDSKMLTKSSIHHWVCMGIIICLLG